MPVPPDCPGAPWARVPCAISGMAGEKVAWSARFRARWPARRREARSAACVDGARFAFLCRRRGPCHSPSVGLLHERFRRGVRADPAGSPSKLRRRRERRPVVRRLPLGTGTLILIGVILSVLAGYVMSRRANWLKKIGLSPRLGRKWRDGSRKTRKSCANTSRVEPADDTGRCPAKSCRRRNASTIHPRDKRDTAANSERDSRTAPEARAENRPNRFAPPSHRPARRRRAIGLTFLSWHSRC